MLLAQLERLPNRLRAAFAAACAERQLPNYLRFAMTTGRGSPERLVGALRCLWEDVEGRTAGSTELKGYLNTCMSLLPEDGAGDLCLVSYYAEDAVSAVVYAIEARLKSDTRAAVESARVAYSSLDAYVSEVLKFRSIGKNQEAQILAHPLVQAELQRQRANLLQLKEIAGDPAGEGPSIAEIRRRAQADAKTFFGPDAI
jgi:uncharacterized protein YjaG (DUF416 family)